MRKGKQPHVQILARSTQLFDHLGEGISNMRFATRKKVMMSQETPSYDLPMPPESISPIKSLSAIAYGFMGSQALFAALELGLFTTLSDEPCGLDELAKRLGTPAGPLRVLLCTCLALDLLTWDGQRYSNSLAAQHFLVSTARSYIGDYYLRQLSAVLYDRMYLVRALLRGEPAEALAYATTLDSPQITEEFIRGQHGGSLAPAYRLARTLDLSRYTRFLDLGGGSGAFAIEAVKRYSGLSAVVFDLPQVVLVTEKIIQESGLEERITCAGGDLRTDPWPGGADLILLSYIISCYEPQTLRALLARCLAYLPGGGGLLIHDFALYADRSAPRNTALFLFGELTVSAQTHPYTVEELGAAMQEAGFREVVMQPFLPDLTFLVSGRKP
jgi:2-hydroxy-4-(methylsulfanyl)butanoate S-methyltransferase